MSITIQDLFRGYSKKYGSSRPLGGNKDGKLEFHHQYENGIPSEAAWGVHLGGKGIGIGIVPLLDDNRNVCWGAIDIDRYPFDHAALEKQIGDNLPLTITKSKSGGAHIWLFLKEPTNAQLVQERLTLWAAALGYGGVEVFPKQYRRDDEKKDIGSWINLPYYGNTRKCIFEGQEVELDKFLEIAEARRITEEQLRSPRFDVVTEDGEFSDGPPCLQMLVQIGVAEGSRNNALFDFAVFLRAKHPEGWREALHRFNREHVDPPSPEKELDAMIKSLDRRDGYNYKCSQMPIKQYCNRALCLKRTYGVARESQKDVELQVMVEGLVKYNTTNPVYKLNIDGVCCDLGGMETLINQQKFKLLVATKIDKLINSVKSDKWQEIVNHLLSKISIIEAPPEASPEGQFYVYLNQFIDTHQTDSRDAVVGGNVWVNEGKAYFRSSDLKRYLNREGFRNLDDSQIYMLLHSIGVTQGRWNVKGKTVSWWCVDAKDLQTEEFEAPTFGKEVFGDGK